MSTLQIELTLSGPCEVSMLRLSGNLSGLEAINFKKGILETLRNRPQPLIMDLRSIEKFDLAGLNALTVIAREMRQRQRQLSLILSETSPLDELMNLTKLHTCLPIRRMQAA